MAQQDQAGHPVDPAGHVKVRHPRPWRAIVGTIGAVDDRASEIAAAVEEQHAVTSDIAGVISDLTEDARRLASQVTETTQAAQSTDELAAAVAAAARDVRGIADALQSLIDDFLARVEAA